MAAKVGTRCWHLVLDKPVVPAASCFLEQADRSRATFASPVTVTGAYPEGSAAWEDTTSRYVLFTESASWPWPLVKESQSETPGCRHLGVPGVNSANVDSITSSRYSPIDRFLFG